jgi:hypothetical protein
VTLVARPCHTVAHCALVVHHRPYQCTQRPGDLLIVPKVYGHATLNPYGFAIGIGTLFAEQQGEFNLGHHYAKGFGGGLQEPYPAWAEAPWRTTPGREMKQVPRPFDKPR